MIELNSFKFGEIKVGVKGLSQSQGFEAFLESVGSNQTKNWNACLSIIVNNSKIKC